MCGFRLASWLGSCLFIALFGVGCSSSDDGVDLCSDAGSRCEDGDDCTQNLCDPGDGSCSYPSEADGTACMSDELAGSCVAGVCELASRCEDAATRCDDSNPCTSDSCDSNTGDCSNDAINEGGACDIGGMPGVCTAGVCEGVMLCADAATRCDDGVDCTDDGCDENTDECVHEDNCEAGTACNAVTGLCENECVPPPDGGQCVPAPKGLAAWWPFDTDTTDIQSGLAGVLVNGAAVAPASGVVGGALSLDGVDDFVEVPDSPALSTPSGLTLDAWVNSTTLASGGAIATKYNSRPQVQQISWFLGSILGDGHLRLVVCDDTVYAQCAGVDTDDPVLTEGCWHFVAATFDVATQEAKIYVDGVEVPSSSNDTGIVTSIANTVVPVRIGAVIFADSDQPTAFWPGLIDEVEIYDRALSSSEIEGIYGAGVAGKCSDNLPEPP